MNYNYIPSLEFGIGIVPLAAQLPHIESILSAEFRGNFARTDFSYHYEMDVKSLIDFLTIENLQLFKPEKNYLRFKNHAVLITNRSNQIKWASQNIESMTGYNLDDVLNKSPRLFQGEQTEQDKIKKLASCLAKEKEHETALTNYRKNGETYICGIKISPLRNKISGEVTHYLAYEKAV